MKRTQQGLENKKGAGRPMEVPKIQLNRRVPFQHIDQVKTLIDLVLMQPDLIAPLLSAAAEYIRQREAHSPHSKGTPDSY